MPKFNPVDRSLLLSSSGIVRLNNTKIYPPSPEFAAQGRNWFTHDLILVNTFPINGPKDTKVRLILINKQGIEDRELLKILGINYYVAGGNRWAAYAYEQVGGAGITFVDGVRVPGIIPINFSNDGWFTYGTLPNGFGIRLCPPIRLPSPLDVEVVPPHIKVWDVNNLGGGQLVWLQEDGIHTWNVSNWPSIVLTTVSNIGRLVVFNWASVWWLFYQEQEGLNRLVCHPAFELTGFHLQDYIQGRQECYRPDVAIQSNLNMLASWALIDNDDSSTFITQPFALNHPRVNLGPEDKEEEPIPVVGEGMIPAFERPMWQAPYFSHHTRYGDTEPARHVGNAIYVDWDDSNIGRFANLGSPLIVNADHPQAVTGGLINLTVAWYVGAGSIDELKQKVERALQLPELPISAYLDGDGWPDSDPFNNDRVWPNIQAYRFPDETLDNFRSRVLRVIERVARYNRPMCLTTRFDDFNGSSTIEAILACMPLYEKWLRNYNFVIHMPFSDRRGNAISSNGSLWNHARSFQYAIPFGRPNRFDYWKPEGSSIETILKNKLGQSRASVVLEPYLREYILAIEQPDNDKEEPPPDDTDPIGDDEEPDINEPLLRKLVESAWDNFNLDTEKRRGEALNWVAWDYNIKSGKEILGLSSKPWPEHVEQPHTGVKIAHDIIQVKPPHNRFFSTMYDVFSDNGPILGVAGPHNHEERPWVSAVQP